MHLERTTLRDPQVGTSLREFVTLRYVEGHANAAPVIRRFRVQAYPTLLVLDSNGAEVATVAPLEAKEFVQELADVRAGKGTLPSLQAAVKAAPQDADAALELGGYLANRYPEQTAAICTQVVTGMKAADPRIAKALFLHGYAESNRNQNEKALALWERVLVEYPKSKAAGDAAIFCTNVLPLLPPARGLAFLEKALMRVDPKYRRSLEYTRGYLYAKAAEAEWLRRGEEAGDEPEVLNNVAWECYLRTWHTDKAVGWARKAVELSQGAPHMLDTLAHLLARQGKLAEAITLEKEALGKLKDDSMRADFEEALAKFKAVQAVRERRTAKASQR